MKPFSFSVGDRLVWDDPFRGPGSGTVTSVSYHGKVYYCSTSSYGAAVADYPVYPDIHEPVLARAAGDFYTDAPDAADAKKAS